MKRFSILILTLCLCLTGCGKQTTEATAQIFAMDTVMEVAAYGEHAEQAVKYTEKRIEELENRLSRTKAHSLVSGLNRDGSIRHLTYDYWNLIARAKEYRDATNGAFDITIAPVMDAWGFTGDSFRVPEQSELDTLLKKVNSDAIQMLGSPSDSVTLGEGQAIDLGGIAKGYTSDCVEAVFYDHEIENGKISLGGNVFVLGTKPDGSDWRVGIKDPRNESGLAAILSLRDAYAITSGGYERYFTDDDGTIYWHIMDPSTGAPAHSGLISVTIIGPCGLRCDGLSTALFVMGREKAAAHWAAHQDYEAVLVDEGGTIWLTPGLKDRFIPVDQGETREIRIL